MTFRKEVVGFLLEREDGGTVSLPEKVKRERNKKKREREREACVGEELCVSLHQQEKRREEESSLRCLH